MATDLLNWEGVRPVPARNNVCEGEITAAAILTHELYDRGFNEILMLHRTPEGKYYTRHDNKLYVYAKEIDGEKLKLKDIEGGVSFAGVLGRFHDISEGFLQPPGIKIRVCWGKRVEKYRILTSRLEKYSARLKKTGCSSDFESYIMKDIDELLYRAKASMKILKSTRYLMCLEGSMRKRQVCINAISSNTMKLTDTGPVIVNVFEMGYNMAEEDIAELVKRVMEQTGDKDAFLRILEEYSKERGNEDYSPEIIKALISFPFNSLKTIARFMRLHEGEDLMMDKYKRYLIKEQKCNLLEV